MKMIRFSFLFIVYLIVIGAYYSLSHQGLIQATTESVEHTLVNHQALRKIVRHYHIPEIKRLKKEGLLPKDYANPHFTSGTFLTQQLHDLTIPIQLKKHKEATQFKYASLNPINPINQSTAYEKKIFKEVTKNKATYFSEIITEKDKPYLFYAIPFNKMEKMCIRCHGDPATAPKKQILKYGSESGYHFKEGDPSALIVMRAPLAEKIEKLNKKLLYMSLTILLIFLSLYAIAEWLIYLIKKQNRKIARTKQIRNELIEEVNKDPMTGLFNRRSFDNTMETELNRARRDNKYLVFFFIDIDFFKQYNDTYGHLKGDEVLIRVATALSDCFQRAHEMTYRLGGEEFGVISSHNENEKDALKWGEHLLQSIRELNIEHKNSPFKKITISIGGYVISPTSQPIEIKDLIHASDEALYEAKNNGRDQAVIRQK